jgi:hypothetical protein
MLDFMKPAGPEAGILAGDGKHGSIIPGLGGYSDATTEGGFNKCGDLKSRAGVHKNIAELSHSRS